jgi:hypothetical protein
MEFVALSIHITAYTTPPKTPAMFGWAKFPAIFSHATAWDEIKNQTQPRLIKGEHKRAQYASNTTAYWKSKALCCELRKCMVQSQDTEFLFSVWDK